MTAASPYAAAYESAVKVIHRDESRSIEETVALVEQIFGL